MVENTTPSNGGKALVDLAGTLNRTQVKPRKKQKYKLHELQEDGSILMLYIHGEKAQKLMEDFR